VLRLGTGALLPQGYEGIGVFVKPAATVCIISVLALVFYKAARKITVFLVIVFTAAGEIFVTGVHCGRCKAVPGHDLPEHRKMRRQRKQRRGRLHLHRQGVQRALRERQRSWKIF